MEGGRKAALFDSWDLKYTFMRRRCEEGCIAVEMELAGMQTVCDYYGFELYDFLVTGDVLDQPEYSIGTLQAANHSLDKLHLALAIAAALE